MTVEQFTTAIQLHHKLEKLNKVKSEIENTKHQRHRLCYIRQLKVPYGKTGWEDCDANCLQIVGEILDRHDLQIRAEIDAKIENIKKQIENL